jgi:hypothetical protein
MSAARPSWPARASFPLALVVAATSLGGIVLPSTYARETASWRAQGIGQDWFDLLVLVPVLVASGTGALRGSRVSRVVLGGALLYATYSFVLYAFEVHFNALFLVYCAGLGLSVFSLAGILAATLREGARGWFEDRAPVRLAGWFLVAVGTMFAALWLAEIVPALTRGTLPASLAEGATFTNAVHVLDLSLFLPAMVASGASLARRRSFGLVLGPMLLAFTALMLLAIVAMMLEMRRRGVPSDLSPLPILVTLGAAALAVFAALVRRIRPAPATPPPLDSASTAA